MVKTSISGANPGEENEQKVTGRSDEPVRPRGSAPSNFGRLLYRFGADDFSFPISGLGMILDFPFRNPFISFILLKDKVYEGWLPERSNAGEGGRTPARGGHVLGPFSMACKPVNDAIGDNQVLCYHSKLSFSVDISESKVPLAISDVLYLVPQAFTNDCPDG
ncbi:hypothetical protein CIB48_g5601 [Xylaria polymorpha]|nr:hypothetical protein CIB48_g5601 [Xylaria polymorpha]